MDNNDLLTLLIAFVLGYFAHQMMRNMCGGRLVEGDVIDSIGNMLESAGNWVTTAGDNLLNKPGTLANAAIDTGDWLTFNAVSDVIEDCRSLDQWDDCIKDVGKGIGGLAVTVATGGVPGKVARGALGVGEDNL